MSNNETGRRNTVIIVVALVLALAMIVGTAIWVKRYNEEKNKETTTATTTETTEAAKYNVDLEYIQRMLKEERFTDNFENYSADSYSTSSTASKEAYWKGVQDGKTVNPLLLAATSSYLSDLGFDTPDVRPSELYNEDGKLNETGEETLKAVKKVIFSEETMVYTTDLGKEAGKYYNSVPSNDDGIVYAQKVGVTGNKACWVISLKGDVDAQFADIMKNDKDSKKSNKEGTTEAKKAETKTVIQLCRCGNTVDKTPKKPTPTTTKQQTTRQQTTRQQTTRQQTTRQQTTRQTTKPNITITFPDITITVPTTKETTTKQQTTRQTTTQTTTQPTTTTRPSTTKNPEKDPVNQGNASRGGGQNDPTEKATSAYQPEKPSKQTTVKTVEETTTKPTTTTKPATTKQATTRPATTNPTTQPPTATPTQKPSSEYKDPDTGKTTVITPDDTFSGRPVLPD